MRSETLKVLLQCCTLDHLKSTPDLHNDSALLFSPFCFLPRTSPLTFVSPVSSREDVQRPEPVPRLPLGARQLRLGGVGLDRAGELQRSVQGAPPPPLTAAHLATPDSLDSSSSSVREAGCCDERAGPHGRGFPYCKQYHIS